MKHFSNKPPSKQALQDAVQSSMMTHPSMTEAGIDPILRTFHFANEVCPGEDGLRHFHVCFENAGGWESHRQASRDCETLVLSSRRNGVLAKQTSLCKFHKH
jgi:hypothetical protein